MGACISCCLTSVVGTAVDIADCIKLEKYFNGKLRAGFSMNGFSEYGAFLKTYDMNVLFPGQVGQYCPAGHLKHFFAMKMIPWVQTKPKSFRTDMNMLTENYIVDQFSRNVAAWIMECPAVYTPYTNDISPTCDDKPIFDEALVRAFARKISNPLDKPAISFETTDPTEISALEHRFIRLVIERVATFDVSGCLDEIYDRLLAGQAQAKADRARLSVII